MGKRIGKDASLRAGAALRMRASLAAALAACLACAVLLLASCAQPDDASVEVRGSANDYSWAELSAISSEIAAAGEGEAAIEVAKRYHLVGDDGVLDGTQAKEIRLADGTETGAVIAGFNHDDAAAGGKAGITFIFADAVGSRAMNGDAGYAELSESDDLGAIGGWNASEMRAWLNGEFVYDLPGDLQAVLVDVAKRSCVVPGLEVDARSDEGAATFAWDSLVGGSEDTLWLPAFVEVCPVSDDGEAARWRPEWGDVLRAEGSTYQLFADAGTGESAPNAALVRSPREGGQPGSWWLRSMETYTFDFVGAGGAPDRGETELASTPLGVVPCFSV